MRMTKFSFFFCERIPLQVSYLANTAGDANFTAVVNVARKTKPLTVNAKAIGYSMSAQLFCENSQGGKVELSDLGLNAINLGEVSHHSYIQKSISLFIKLIFCSE